MKTINKKIILIVGILILVIGISFAYFLGTTMFGGSGSNVEGTTATIYGSTLRVDGTIDINKSDIYPGYRDISAIRVTATGNNETVAYDLVWSGTNDLSNLKYTVYYSKNELTGFETHCEVKTKVVEGSQRIAEECTITNENLLTNKVGEGTITKDATRETITGDRVIKTTNSGTIEYYYIIVEYQNNGNQNDDLNGRLTGNIHAEAGSNTGDVNIMAIYTREDDEQAWASRDTVPAKSENYKLHSDSSCGGEEIITYANGKINIADIVNKGTICNLYFEKVNGTTGSSLAENPIKTLTTSTDFGKMEPRSDATPAPGLYEFTGRDSKKTQFYRGAVNNNYVRLGKDSSNYTYWRIVRFDEEENIRLIYDGTVGHNNGEASNDRVLTTNYEGTNMYTPKYHSTHAEANVKWSNSEIKTYLEGTWMTAFESKLSAKEQGQLTTGKFCSDSSVASTENGKKFYGARGRLEINKTPSFDCASGDLTTARVGMLSADEYSFAGGGGYGSSYTNTSFYLYTGKNWWTLSPYRWNGSNADVFFVLENGYLNSGWVTNSYGLRPVIILEGDTLFDSAGDGTKTIINFENKEQTTINKCTRMPIDLVDNINKATNYLNNQKNNSNNKKITFSKFVIEACYYALDNLEDDKKV